MIVANPDTFRKNIRGKINNILTNPVKSSNLEIGVFNFAIKEANNRKVIKKWDNPHFVQLYKDRLRTIVVNLKDKEILKQLEDNTITPQSYAMMTHYEMCPKKWDTLIAKRLKEIDLNTTPRLKLQQTHLHVENANQINAHIIKCKQGLQMNP